MALASPRRVVAALHRAHELPGDAFGINRSLQLPGYSVTVGEIAAAVRHAGGAAAYARIRWRPDPQIEAIVSSWPKALDGRRAAALGFAADADIDEAVQAFVEDDLEAQMALG
jgi:nucleoside-diphosphate-sugar epimerase